MLQTKEEAIRDLNYTIAWCRENNIVYVKDYINTRFELRDKEVENQVDQLVMSKSNG